MREFWILQESGSNRAILAQPGETRTWNGLHVIEYSAYESVVKALQTIQKYETSELGKAHAAFKDADKKGDELFDSWQSCLKQLTTERARSAKLVEEWESACERANYLQEERDNELSRSAKLVEAFKCISELPKGTSINELDGWYAKRKAEAALAEYESQYTPTESLPMSAGVQLTCPHKFRCIACGKEYAK